MALALSGAAWADRLPVLSPLPDAIFSASQQEAPATGRLSPLAQSAPAPSVNSATPERSIQRLNTERLTERGPDFYAGIKAYREGDYRKAEQTFEVLHRQQPENTQITYYLAITQAQLGRFQKAESLYREIIQLEPKGKAASLAQKGLDYLPKEDDLDQPPRFSAATDAAAPSAAAGSSSTDKPATAKSAAASPPASAAAQTAAMAEAMRQSMQAGMQGMSPQDWMMMQMLQGQGGNNGNGANMNPMSWMMIPGIMGNTGNSGYDPGVMSNMMMNQMMQGFGLGGDSEQNP
ncbi:tetratricopeptide repeat protein [Vampirovibrio chlorellavorus]|uniref:tetratricopeptide repeat protein n=1 Tax=Vampirovibrio chlorellavorus TaxID=758823 RepID=UPI0026EDE0BC|nr:tetratricopeptide repeat protein [Vampirovibrio chlorellavorus]